MTKRAFGAQMRSPSSHSAAFFTLWPPHMHC